MSLDPAGETVHISFGRRALTRANAWLARPRRRS
jgi:hypothetical protein